MIDWANPTVSGFFRVFLWVFGVLTIRYLVLAGGAFLYFWKWKKEAWRNRRLQRENPPRHAIVREIKYSILTTLIFAIVGLLLGFGRHHGWFKIYAHVADYGWLYYAFSLTAAILVHDAYFYFAHRLMHTKFLFKHVHRVHHLSTNPSPFAAFSFHPSEAIVEAAVLPLLLLVLPMHVSAIIAFMFFMTILNVLGHLGYEIYPHGFATNKWSFWNNSSTHHNMHHRYVHCNYGLYFNLWDRIFKTNHAHYIARFEEVTSEKQQRSREAEAA